MLRPQTNGKRDTQNPLIGASLVSPGRVHVVKCHTLTSHRYDEFERTSIAMWAYELAGLSNFMSGEKFFENWQPVFLIYRFFRSQKSLKISRYSDIWNLPLNFTTVNINLHFGRLRVKIDRFYCWRLTPLRPCAYSFIFIALWNA